MVVAVTVRSRSQADYGAAMIEIAATALAVNIDACPHCTIGSGCLSLIYLSLIQVADPPLTVTLQGGAWLRQLTALVAIS